MGTSDWKFSKNQFAELREDLFSAQKKFDEGYAGELEKLREKAVAAGILI